ncbi:crotonase/enoyl-CoA hydratase family protein [Mesobacterium pallidum]|uniref:crotonase/enoyl-CoA hydratase family protein n=1 Tax=Mesobacterium pallidum TaxID=2872037 RepID=UPI001EE323A9|nr:crotonase/enoyl-CoA hydratase family protein [Mesobacterium pallidum]
MSRVSTTVENHVAHVRLTRGDKMNALDPAMIDAIIAAGEALMDRTDVRCVVLSGEGRAFCAGLDVASFGALTQGDPADVLMPRTHGQSNRFQRVAMVWHELPMPVIAAVQGTCFGGGFQLALGADIRIAAPGTQLSIMEMKWGLVPDMGGMVLLPRLAPSDILRRLTYTAEVFSAEAALEWELVTELADDPLARAQELAAVIASRSPSAVRAAKRLFEVAETEAPEAVLLAESREQAALIGKPDQVESVMANMQNRAPTFG